MYKGASVQRGYRGAGIQKSWYKRLMYKGVGVGGLMYRGAGV